MCGDARSWGFPEWPHIPKKKKIIKSQNKLFFLKKELTNGALDAIIITVPAVYGPVVQLVRTLACHARGRRFEPVPGRQICPDSSVGRAVD